MATKRPTTAPAPTADQLLVEPQDVRDALGLRGGVLAHRAGTATLLVIAPLQPLQAPYAVIADQQALQAYVAEFGSPTAAAEQLTAELRAELAVA